MSLQDLASLKEELKELIISVANLQNITVADIKDDTSLFQNGLGLDSIDLLELVIHLDSKYGIKLQNNEQGREALQTVQSLAQVINNHSKDKILG